MTITEKAPLNGVDTPTLFATRDAVKQQNEIAKFQFRATNTWVTGTHSRSTVSGFYGAMQEMQHVRSTVVDADHPAVLVGEDNGPTPVEYLLHAIAACLTGGIANIAAARGVRLTKVSSTVAGDIDLLGILGLSDGTVRNGYEQLRVTFHIEGDADEATLRSIVDQSRQRSPTRPRSRTTWSRPASVRRRLTARPAWPAPTTTVSRVFIELSFRGRPAGRGAGRPVARGEGPRAVTP